MKSLLKVTLLILLAVQLISCGNKADSIQNNDQTDILHIPAELSIIDEVTEQDFVLKIEAERTSYKEHEKVNIVAYLTYIGENEEITIGHAASPVGFNMQEHTNDIKIWGAMNQPYLTTTLKKDEPQKYELTGIGSYSEQDDKLVIAYNKATSSMRLLKGLYTINAFARFDIDDPKFADKKNYAFEATIQIEVTP